MRLAWGVIADRDRWAWLVETGERVDPRDHELPEGAAVVLGDRDSSADQVAAARNSLSELIATGGSVVAGAGIDLGDGFVSARLAGATGDRRDAVLAALRVLDMADAWRVGERTATLVALFGVTATKPVGAEAERAIAEGRWAAVVLASAAAEVLGPEQLVQVLRWEAPEGVDPIPSGAPSALAANLRRVLEPYSGRRRLELLADLWRQVCTRQSVVRSRRLLIEGQDLRVQDGLRERFRQHDEQCVADLVPHDRTRPLPLKVAIRYVPGWDNHWKFCAERLIQDAIAATVLLRMAVSVHDHGVIEGVTRMRDEIAAAAALFTKSELKRAARRVPELSILPARPGVIIREIGAWFRQAQPLNSTFERIVRRRLTAALAYGIVIDDACHDLLCDEIPADALPDQWDSEALRAWRNSFGYTGTRAPGEWRQDPYVRYRQEGRAIDRLADRLAADPAATEQAHDLLWYGELADAIVRLRGHERAEIQHGHRMLHFETNPPVLQPDPLTPRPDSLPLAVAGAAQLLALGAKAPARTRDWAGLCAGLMTSGAVAQALISEFEVAEPVLALDASVLPGTGARIEIARNAGRLAEWADYMGNCIAGPWYQAEAVRGRSILVAVRDEQNTIVINAELRSTRFGWAVDEIAGRFNSEPDPELKKALVRWALDIRVAEPEPAVPMLGALEPPARSRRSRPNPVREVGPVLRDAVRVALAATPEGLRVLTAVGGAPDADPKVLTALRRSNSTRLDRLCAEALDTNRVTLPELWSATASRPLTAAVEALNPALLSRYPRLKALTADAPLPSKALRELVKDPELAIARSMDVLSLRLRATLGRMALADDPVFARALVRRPSLEVICPFAMAITCAQDRSYPATAIAEPRSVTVSGFPATSLSDAEGPWRQHWPVAVEFGANIERFWDQTAEHGVLVPNSWLGAGGWQALWGRAWSLQSA